METIGYFTELGITYKDDGKFKDHLGKQAYDKNAVIKYLKAQKLVAICPKPVNDHVTGERIANSFCVKTDGEYEWPDSLEYHIAHYDVILPEALIKKAQEH